MTVQTISCMVTLQEPGTPILSYRLLESFAYTVGEVRMAGVVLARHGNTVTSCHKDICS